MRCPWPVFFAAICMAGCLSISTAVAQETENRTPPAILYLVPHLDLHNHGGDGRLFGGLDIAFAMPLSLRSNLTATHFANWHGDTSTSAQLNYDRRLGTGTTLRGSVGIFDDHFGYGITAHRFMKELGVGAFVQNVDSDWQAGVMLTREVPWGVRLGPVRRPKEDAGWYSGGSSLGRLGARAALEYRRTDGGTVLGTRAAFFPSYEYSWPRGGGDAQSASATGLQFAPPAHLVWKYQTEGPIRTGAAVLDGVAYVGSYDEWLYAVDVKSGQRQWRFPANSPVTAAPSVYDGQIFFGTQAGELFCIRPPRKGQVPAGHLVWRYEAGAPITASPLVTGAGLVLFGSADGSFHAVDRTTGKKRWVQKTGGPIVGSASKAVSPIPADLDEQVQPASRAGAILCASTDGRLYAFAESSGELVWSLDTGAPLTAGAAIRDSVAYAGNYHGKLWAVNVAGGHVKWTADVGGAMVNTPAVGADTVCVATRDGAVVALSVEDGTELWRQATSAPVTAPPTIMSGGTVYVTARDGHVRALKLATGEQVWEHFTGEPLTTGAAIAEGHMLIGGENGGLYAYRAGAGRSVQVASASEQPVVLTAPDATVPQTPPATTDTSPAASTAPSAPAATGTETTEDDFPRPTVSASEPPVSSSQVEVPPTPVTSPASATGGFAPPQMSTAETETSARISPTERVVTPVAIEPGPTASSTPASVPAPAADAAPSAAAEKLEQSTLDASELDEDDPLHLTVLTTPVHGDEPLLVTNRDWAYIRGTVRDTDVIVGIEVNGQPVAIEDNSFLHRELFDGPGSYLVRVRALSTDGAVSERMRRVQVIDPTDARVPQTVRISGVPEAGTSLMSITMGTSGSISAQRLVAEIQRADGAVLQRWSESGSGPFTVTWDGTALSGDAVAAGEYLGVFALMVGDEMVACIRQPLLLEH